MTDLFFVDSNVFIYRYDRSAPEKRARANLVVKALWRRRAGRISVQVLSELYAVATRKLAEPVPADDVRADVRDLARWSPCPLSDAVRERAWGVEDRYGFSWWDALIVAAAIESGCGTLLSEDLQDGQILDGIVVRNPFAHPLADLGLGAES